MFSFVSDPVDVGVGAVLTGQMLPQVLLALYFVLCDFTMFWQWLLYEQKKGTMVLVATPLLALCALLMLMSALHDTELEAGLEAGAYLGWFAAFCYNASRASQVLHTYRRRTTEGVSIYLFLAAFLGEVSQAVSFVGSLEALPWYA
jgi:hypothetical protein